jgi:hypothetical protein
VCLLEYFGVNLDFAVLLKSCLLSTVFQCHASDDLLCLTPSKKQSTFKCIFPARGWPFHKDDLAASADRLHLISCEQFSLLAQSTSFVRKSGARGGRRLQFDFCCLRRAYFSLEANALLYDVLLKLGRLGPALKRLTLNAF